MFHRELLELLFQVVKSWQVIATTVALVLYMFLVGYAARTYHPSFVSKSKPQKKAKKAKKSKKVSKNDAESDEPQII
jgi:uncharacterized membrane protein